MNHVFRSSLVKLLCGSAELSRRNFQISRGNGEANLFHLRSQRAAKAFVADPEFFVLAKAFFGCWCIWHGSIEIAALAEIDGLGNPKKFEPQSMASLSATVQS
jgi:hypothetical protein